MLSCKQNIILLREVFVRWLEFWKFSKIPDAVWASEHSFVRELLVAGEVVGNGDEVILYDALDFPPEFDFFERLALLQGL